MRELRPPKWDVGTAAMLGGFVGGFGAGGWVATSIAVLEYGLFELLMVFFGGAIGGAALLALLAAIGNRVG